MTDAGLPTQTTHRGLTAANSESSAATIERLESAIKEINSRLDRVFLSASLHSPSGSGL